MVATTLTTAWHGAAREGPQSRDRQSHVSERLPTCSSARGNARSSSSPAGTASRQSITMLASPYASRRVSFFCCSQHLDHRPGGVIHRLVEIRPRADGDEIGLSLRVRERLDRARPAFRGEAMEALVDVDDLADAAIPRRHHRFLGLLLADLSLLDQQLHRLRLEDVERLVEIAVDADVIQASLVSMRGHSSFMFLMTSTVTFISLYAVSSAVRLISPLPCAACESPVHRSAPLTNTGT